MSPSGLRGAGASDAGALDVGAGASVRRVRLYRCERQLYAFPFDKLRDFTPEELQVMGRSRGPTVRR